MKEFIVNFRREFELMKPEEIAFPRSINAENTQDTTSIYKYLNTTSCIIIKKKSDVMCPTYLRVPTYIYENLWA